MDQQQKASNSIPPPSIPLKRRRGRPRKDPSLIPIRRASFPLSNKDQTPNHGENAPIPPGFEQTNGNQPQTTSRVNDGNIEDAMVGKVVTGVIEASFEAGYLLSVRVGESETSLRGIMFKPGHYVPVSSENDVAPTLQMIRRNEVPLPSVNPVKKRRGRKQTEHHPNSAPSSNQLPIVPFQPSHPLGSRGTLVPVVLQPVNLSNGATPAVEATPIASQPAHLAASTTNPVPLSHATDLAVPKTSQTDSGLGSQSFEELASAAKRMQGSQSVGTQNENGISASKNLSKHSAASEEQVEDLTEPLMVKPLQAIRSGFTEQSASLSHAFTERRTGKMTELLLAVQENLKERQMTENHQEFKSPEN